MVPASSASGGGTSPQKPLAWGHIALSVTCLHRLSSVFSPASSQGPSHWVRDPPSNPDELVQRPPHSIPSAKTLIPDRVTFSGSSWTGAWEPPVRPLAPSAVYSQYSKQRGLVKRKLNCGLLLPRAAHLVSPSLRGKSTVLCVLCS